MFPYLNAAWKDDVIEISLDAKGLEKRENGEKPVNTGG